MKSLLKHIRTKAVAGILLILPVAITVFVLQFLFSECIPLVQAVSQLKFIDYVILEAPLPEICESY